MIYNSCLIFPVLNYPHLYNNFVCLDNKFPRSTNKIWNTLEHTLFCFPMRVHFKALLNFSVSLSSLSNFDMYACFTVYYDVVFLIQFQDNYFFCWFRLVATIFGKGTGLKYKKKQQIHLKFNKSK